MSARWLQFKPKENETPVILEESSFFYIFVFCSSWLTQLYDKFQWHWALGSAMIWCGASALQGMMTHQMSHYCSWDLGNCSVLWLMLDSGTVAIITGERPWLWAGIPQYWGTISNPMHFPINSEGDQLHPSQNKTRTQCLYICVHTQHTYTYIHMYIQNWTVSV